MYLLPVEGLPWQCRNLGRKVDWTHKASMVLHEKGPRGFTDVSVALRSTYRKLTSNTLGNDSTTPRSYVDFAPRAESFCGMEASNTLHTSNASDYFLTRYIPVSSYHKTPIRRNSPGKAFLAVRSFILWRLCTYAHLLDLCFPQTRSFTAAWFPMY